MGNSKEIKVIPGNGKDLNISDIKEHIKFDKKKEEIDKKKIIIPSEKNNKPTEDWFYIIKSIPH